MNITARELADRVIAERKKSWEKSDPTIPVVSTERLNPEDEAAVRRAVQEEGYQGHDLEEMVRKVSTLIVERVEGLADNVPADNAD